MALDFFGPSAAALSASIGAVTARAISPTQDAYGLSTAGSAAANTAALTACFADAAAQNVPVVIPPGEYNFTGPITLAAWDGMDLRGAGQRMTTLTNTATAGANGIELRGGAGMDDGKAHGVKMSSFTLRGNSASGVGLLVGGPGGATSTGPLRINEVQSREHGSDGIRFMQYADHTMLVSVTCDDNLGRGLAVGTSSTAANLTSELTILGGYYAYNTLGGIVLYGTGRTATIVGTEMSQNLSYDFEVSSLTGSQPTVTVMGAYFEHVTTNVGPFVQIGSTAISQVHFIGCHFLDGTTAGMPTAVNIRSGLDNTVFDSCHASLKAGGVFVKEATATTSKAHFRNCTVTPAATAFLRQLSSGTKVNVVQGGPTANRWTVGTVAGESYFDTTLNKPLWWDGAAWRDATGTTV